MDANIQDCQEAHEKVCELLHRSSQLPLRYQLATAIVHVDRYRHKTTSCQNKVILVPSFYVH